MKNIQLDEAAVMNAVSVDAKETILNQLAISFGVLQYKQIMKMIGNPGRNISTDVESQHAFNCYYCMRRNKDWRAVYYNYFEHVKNSNPSFGEILRYLKQETPTCYLEPSFSSKMLATIDKNMPIWDDHVFELSWFEKRLGTYS